MIYFKRAVQLLLLVIAVWLTIQNYDVKVESVRMFNKEITNISIMAVIFCSLVIGALISAFFSALKEWKTIRQHKITVKEMKNTIKDLELRSKDLTITQNELEKSRNENSTLKNEIKTLKEILSFPNKDIDKKDSKLIDY